MAERLKGTRILLESLKKEGVDTIFGLPGGAVIEIYDELFDMDFHHILVRHEQAAAHAADGYARASGKVGVVLVTSGPGATNTVTGIASAYMDSVPIVVFTGQVPTYLIGNDAFQEVDMVGITRPITKHNFLVKDVNDLARIVKEAFYIARTGRPGPVVVDLPKDVLAEWAEFDYDRVEMKLPGYKPNVKGHIGQIKKAVNKIFEARRPVLYIGGGVISSNASEEIRELARLLHIPVTSTLMALGAYPGDDPLFLGMLGMHGTFRANMAVTESDLLIAVGARFDDRVTGDVNQFAPQAEIIHIDIDPASISKNVQVDIPIVGDVKIVVRDMLKIIKDIIQKKPEKLEQYHKDLEPWHESIERWKETYPLAYRRDGKTVKPQFVIETLYKITKGENIIITTEVGQNQMWAAQYFLAKYPRTFITSGGLGAMGYGFPAAIGAQVARPDATVVDIAGDGSIQMNIQELATAVQYHLPVKIFILNNKFLGMVRQWQELFYDRKYSYTCEEVQPDFVKLAEAYGAKGFIVDREEMVEPVILEVLQERDKPVVVEFLIEREENVFPMVPAGGALNKMLLV